MNELFRIFKLIDENNLTNDDKSELLILFNCTKNDLVRNHLALIFSDIVYKEAVPDIMEKINEKDMRHKAGTLVFALGNLVSESNILQLIKIMYEHDYESRLTAFDIIGDLANTLNDKIRKDALELLETFKNELAIQQSKVEQNSPLHFITETIKLLKK